MDLIVQADGGSRGNPGPAGYGAVVLNAATGEVLAERADYIGEATNNVAEYEGLVAGLTAAHAIDAAARIEVNMDSKLVVEQMSGKWQIKHPNMRELAKAARAAHEPTLVTYKWIPREMNSHADRLANEAMDAEEREEVWTATPGIKLNPILERLESLGEPTTLFLVRHGETALTPSRTFSGGDGSNPELSAHGKWQAERVSHAVKGLEISAIYASPLKRTQQTAEEIAKALGLSVTTDERLMEVRYGKWDGLTLAEVRERDPELLNSWLSTSAATPPGGESYTTMTERVNDAIVEIVARHPEERVLIVSHSTPIRHLLSAALHAPDPSAHRLEITPCAVNVAAFWPDGTSLVRAINDTSHLTA